MKLSNYRCATGCKVQPGDQLNIQFLRSFFWGFLPIKNVRGGTEM